MLAGICQMLRQSPKYVDSKPCVISAHPERTLSLHPGVHATTRKSLVSLRRRTRGTDTFIFGGGSLLQDVTSLRSLFWYALAAMLVGDSAKTTVWWGQGIGPLNHVLSRKIVGYLVRKADIVAVRDDISATVIRACAPGVAVDLCSDPAFVLGHGRLIERSSDGGICYSLRRWRSKELDLHPSILPPNAWHLPMHLPVDCLNSPGELVWDTGSNPFPLVMDAIGKSRAVISVRLHTLILAASLGIAVLPISYDPKVTALAARIGAPSLLFEDALRAGVSADVEALLIRADDAGDYERRRLVAKQMFVDAYVPLRLLEGLSHHA